VTNDLRVPRVETNDPAAADEGTDIFSLGVVFYELVTGKHPYDDVDEVLKRKEILFTTGSIRSAMEIPGAPAPDARPRDVKEVIAQGFCGFHHHQVSNNARSRGLALPDLRR